MISEQSDNTSPPSPRGFNFQTITASSDLPGDSLPARLPSESRPETAPSFKVVKIDDNIRGNVWMSDFTESSHYVGNLWIRGDQSTAILWHASAGRIILPVGPLAQSSSAAACWINPDDGALYIGGGVRYYVDSKTERWQAALWKVPANGSNIGFLTFEDPLHESIISMISPAGLLVGGMLKSRNVRWLPCCFGDLRGGAFSMRPIVNPTGSQFARIADCNAKNEILGEIWFGGSNPEAMIFRDGADPAPLHPRLNRWHVYAMAINDYSDVVVRTLSSPEMIGSTYLLKNGSAREILMPTVSDMNGNLVIGSDLDGPLIWDGTETSRLAATASPGWEITHVHKINARNEILARGRSGGVISSIKLVPV